MAAQRKCVLFVDDEPGFLNALCDILAPWAGDGWEILTAGDVAGALAILQSRPVDMVVLDLHMPVVNGVQLIGLLRRAYPQVIRVVLTDQASDTERTASLHAGAQLFLEKPVTQAGWRDLYEALEELLRLPPAEGFRGVLRAAGLQDILQMECLAHNSSVLEVVSPSCTGRVFIEAGQLVHAEAGAKRGLEALEWLLGLKGGEFSLHPFTPPPERTLTERWEFLLMEAARRRDEAEGMLPPAGEPVEPGEAPEALVVSPPQPAPPPAPAESGPAVGRAVGHLEPIRELMPTAGAEGEPALEEVLLVAPHGEVLFEWQCARVNDRLRFLEFLSERVEQLAQRLPVGQLDRWEAEAGPVRVLCQMRPERTVWVRRSLRGREPWRESGSLVARRSVEAIKANALGWLASVSPVRGLLALGVQFADQTAHWQSWSQAFPLERLEPGWQPVIDTLQVLRLNRLPYQRVCWRYGRVTLLSQGRGDGVRLGMLIDSSPAEVETEALQRLITEFCAGAAG